MCVLLPAIAPSGIKGHAVGSLAYGFVSQGGGSKQANQCVDTVGGLGVRSGEIPQISVLAVSL